MPSLTNKKIVVTGAAGFIGSWLCERLVKNGNTVIGIDNFMTGRLENLNKIIKNGNFIFLEEDIRNSNLDICYQGADFIFHLACPAATVVFTEKRVETLDICYLGTKNILEAVKDRNIPVFFTSSSEVYGNMDKDDMVEEDLGNVNFTGIRSGYDEGKRVAEALVSAYRAKFGIAIYVVRLFNTYGGRMTPNGRLVPTVIKDIWQKKVASVWGSGQQTRTLNYVEDTIDGMLLVLEKDYREPINVGGINEMTVEDIIKGIARVMRDVIGVAGIKIIKPNYIVKDEPLKRKPNINKLLALGYSPKYDFNKGIEETFRVMKEEDWL